MRSLSAPDVDAALRAEFGLGATEAGGARLVERIMLPALNVRGIAVGRRGRSGGKRDSHRGHRLHRLPPRARPDAREGARAGRVAPSFALGYTITARDADRRRPTLHGPAREARLGHGLPPGADGHGSSVLARGRARGLGGGGRPRGFVADPGRQRAHASVRGDVPARRSWGSRSRTTTTTSTRPTRTSACRISGTASRCTRGCLQGWASCGRTCVRYLFRKDLGCPDPGVESVHGNRTAALVPVRR